MPQEQIKQALNGTIKSPLVFILIRIMAVKDINVRLDNGEIFKHERTKEGYLRIWMAVSRVGDLTYYDSLGRPYVENVPEETLFDSQSLTTAWGKPITFGDHPRDKNGYHLLNPSNAKYDMVGMTMQSMLPMKDRLNLLAVVTDQEAIEGVERGIKQVSAAYSREIRIDGGKAYQVKRDYNHYTILERGRAGEKASVYFDSFNYDILGGPIIHNERGEIETNNRSDDIIKTNKEDKSTLLQLINYGH